MKMESQDRIDDYLFNRMTEADRQVFENDVANDVELKEQLEYTKRMQQAVKSRNEKLASIKKWEEAYECEPQSDDRDSMEFGATGSGYDYSPGPSLKESQKKLHSRRKRVILWASGIAAVFIAGILVMHGLRVREYKELAMVEKNRDILEKNIENNEILEKKIKEKGEKADRINMGLGKSCRVGKSFSNIETLLYYNRFEEAFERIKSEIQTIREDSLEIVMDTTLSETELEHEKLLIEKKQENLKWLTIRALVGLNRQDEAISLLDEFRKTEGPYRVIADTLYNHIIKK